MHLVQVLLPVADDAGSANFGANLSALREEFIQRFGGATIYSSAPAEGLWKDDAGTSVRDRIVLVEVMAADLDRTWWGELKQRLEVDFQQDEIMIRAIQCNQL